MPPANTLPVVVEGIPGLHVRYSGGGTTIVQQVVTDVIGKPFPKLMRELVLKPAGMSNSTFEQPLPAAIADQAASGHPWNGVPVEGGWHVYPEMAAAGLWATAGDLARLGAELMRTLNGAESALRLSRETVAAMLRPQVPGIKIGDDFPGLGWFCSGEGDAFRFGHGGQDEGFIAHIRMFPELGAGAVVMINSVQGWPLPGEILAAVGREFGWPSVPDERTQVTVEGIGRFAGTYRNAKGVTVEVPSEGSILALAFEGQEPIPLQAVRETEFASDTLDLKATFAPGGRDARSSVEVRHLGSVLRFDRAGEDPANDQQRRVSSEDLAVIRRAYAKQVLGSVSIDDQRVEDAFATVPREDFLGPGPWPILRWRGYVRTPDDDPTYLYSDVLVGILPERGLNNGMPSYHATLMSNAGIREGEHVVHVGAGTGYYTAILAHLAGESGRVTAIEFDPELAERATANLATMTNVDVIEGDGAVVPFDAADVIYVNAGATRPADRWLDGLAEGGRLILPLTATKSLSRKSGKSIERHGAVFRIERLGAEFLAQWIAPVGVYPCEGGRDDASEAALDAALQKGGWEAVTRLYRTDDIPEERCWLRAPGWCLAYE